MVVSVIKDDIEEGINDLFLEIFHDIFMSMKCCGYYTCNQLPCPILLQVKITSVFILETMGIYRTEEMDPIKLMVLMK